MTVTELCCPLDVEEGLARAGGEQDFYKELLDLMLEDVPPRLEELRSAVKSADPVRVASVAHAIKGAAANLAALPLRDAAFRLESKGRQGATTGLDPLVDELTREFDRLAEYVKSF